MIKSSSRLVSVPVIVVRSELEIYKYKMAQRGADSSYLGTNCKVDSEIDGYASLESYDKILHCSKALAGSVFEEQAGDFELKRISGLEVLTEKAKRLSTSHELLVGIEILPQIIKIDNFESQVLNTCLSFMTTP